MECGSCQMVDQGGEVHQVPIYNSWKSVPVGLKDRHQWSLQGRKVIKGSVPRALLRLPTLPLEQPRLKHFFDVSQTELFRNPFVRDLHRFTGWFRPYRYDFLRHPNDHSAKFVHMNRRWGWKDLRAHVLGQAQIGVIGDKFAGYLVFDLDYHTADPRRQLFLGRCQAFVTDVPHLARILGAAWFLECRTRDISGIRFILLLPEARWIPKLRQPAEEFLARLDARYPTLAAVESFRRVEIFPALRADHTQGRGCRLPLGVDITSEGVKQRVTITDEFLHYDPKTNLRKFAEWVDRGGGNVPTDTLLTFLAENTPDHGGESLSAGVGGTAASGRRRSKPRQAGMGQLPYPLKGNLKRLLRDFKEGDIPADTIGKFVAPVARLVHFWGGNPEEVVRACIDRWRLRGVDTGFSDRVSGDDGELWRAFVYLKEQIEDGNGYQPRPEESMNTLREVVACWRDQGFDPVAYLLGDAELPPTSEIDVSDVDFEFEDSERMLLCEELHPIVRGRYELDIRHTYECARRIVAFARKYPGREFACRQLLPVLCADLPIQWPKNKCYRVMRCLLDLRFLSVRFEYATGRSWLWRGNLPQFNKARTFEVGEALRHHFKRPDLANTPPPLVSTISHFSDSVCGFEEDALDELQAECDRLLGRALAGRPGPV